MNYKLISTALFLLIIVNTSMLFSQNMDESFVYQPEYKQYIGSLFYYDNKQISIILDDEHKFLKIDSIITDTLDGNIGDLYFDYTKLNLISIYRVMPKYLMYKFDFKTLKFKEPVEIPIFNLTGLNNDSFVGMTHSHEQLYYSFYNIKTKIKDEKLNQNDLPIGKDSGFDYGYYSPKSKNLLLTTGMEDDAVEINLKYFIIDMNDGSYSEYHEFDSLQNAKYESTRIYTWDNVVISMDFNYFFVSNTIRLVRKNNGAYILDKNFKIIGNCLPKRIRIKGYNYKNDKVYSVNLSSTLDKKESIYSNSYQRAIIPYKITYEIEKNLYNIYSDLPVVKTDLKKLGKHELKILKNMVFAKHNYKFNSDYYQAFFNLFTFYNNKEKRTARTKNVNNLLTEADKQNLKIILEELRVRN